jgi:hypothetical protein
MSEGISSIRRGEERRCPFENSSLVAVTAYSKLVWSVIETGRELLIGGDQKSVSDRAVDEFVHSKISLHSRQTTSRQGWFSKGMSQLKLKNISTFCFFSLVIAFLNSSEALPFANLPFQIVGQAFLFLSNWLQHANHSLPHSKLFPFAIDDLHPSGSEAPINETFPGLT